ncbi:MAG: T9SS type A sorting domain-containing protein, partial [Bacteroidia bacterium]|nr:T9SS type A sorting domain-containing protein [Bacteroidia bacterium]
LQSCCLKETNARTPQTMVLTGENPVLEQNIPNPFSQSTTIQYYVPRSVKTAVMQITDVNGNVLQTAELPSRGADSIVIQTGDLSWGTYFYSLILDGKVFETKKMIVSNR